jgi:anion transporter
MDKGDSVSANVQSMQHPGLEKTTPKKKIETWRYVIAAIGIIGLVLIATLTPDSTGLKQVGKTSLGILFFLVSWWISEICSFFVTGFVGMALMLLLRVAEMPVVFAGFSNNVFIFLVFAFTMAVAVTESGLGKRIAYAIIARTRPSYAGILITLVILGMVLAAIIPLGNACVVVLGTIGLMILPVFGQTEDKKSNVGRGIFTMLGETTMMSANCYVSGVGAILIIGILTKAGHPLNYLQWLLVFLPATLAVTLLLALIIPRIFPPEVKAISVEKFKEFQAKLHDLGPASAAEKKTAVIVAGMIFFWIIGGFFKLSPITVCIAGGVLLMFPFIGTVSAGDFNKKIPWAMVFFTGFALTLGPVLQQTGVAAFLVKLAKPIMGSSSLFTFCLKVFFIATVAHLLLPSLAALATFVPLIMASATAQGFSILAPIMVFVVAHSAAMMVYQQTQTVISYGFNQFDPRDQFRPGLVAALLWLLMTPILILYVSKLPFAF